MLKHIKWLVDSWKSVSDQYQLSVSKRARMLAFELKKKSEIGAFIHTFEAKISDKKLPKMTHFGKNKPL